LTKFENHANYNCRIATEDGCEYMIYANWMHNANMDHWQGWHCEAGVNRISIDKNFGVWGGECRNDYLGNLQSQWNLIQMHTVCKQDRCTGCTDDLAITKWLPR